jgi:LysR family transcriptional regulator, glycine cleavage system transcriptional activator
MRRLPPLNALRAFEAAARHLSFTKAAEELHVTQAAISHQIKALEAWFGQPLFRRRNRSLLLTDPGQAYLPAVRDAFDSLNQATQRLFRRDHAGPLTISVFASFAAVWLVPRLGRFADRHPDIDVRIAASDVLVDFDQDDEVDLGIRYGRGDWPGLKVERFLTEELFVVCSPRLLNGPNGLRALQDLNNQTFLHDQMRTDWAMWMRHAGLDFKPKRNLGFSHTNMVIQAAIDGLGVALGRRVLVEDDLAAGRLVKPFDLSLHAEFAYYLVCPPQCVDRPKIKAFRDWVFEEAARSPMAKPKAA